MQSYNLPFERSGYIEGYFNKPPIPATVVGRSLQKTVVSQYTGKKMYTGKPAKRLIESDDGSSAYWVMQPGASRRLVDHNLEYVARQFLGEGIFYSPDLITGPRYQRCSFPAGVTTLAAAVNIETLVVSAPDPALSASQKMKAGASLGVTLGEMGETFGLMTQKVSQITDMFSAVKGLDFKKARKLAKKAGTFDPRLNSSGSELKSLGSNWLEFQLGWLPLYSDIHALADAAAQLGVSCQADQEVEASKVSRQPTFKAPLSYTFWAPCTAKDGSIRNSYQQSIAVPSTDVYSKRKLKIRYRAKGGIKTFNAHMGLDNPALIAWELVPLSFVVDYFLPIGDFLNQLNMWDGFDFVSGVHVRNTRLIQEVKTVEVQLKVQVHNYKRTILSTFPTMPSMDIAKPMTFVKAANLLALGIGNFVDVFHSKPQPPRPPRPPKPSGLGFPDDDQLW